MIALNGKLLNVFSELFDILEEVVACEIDCASSDNIFCLEDEEVTELPTYGLTIT